MKFRIGVIAFAALGVSLAACADDGNDGALQQERAAQLAAEYRVSQTTVLVTEAPAEAADEHPVDDAGLEVATTTVPPVEPTGVVISVTALDNSFRPQSVEISVGDEVLWENRGLNEHNVLQVDGEGWGVVVEDFQPGAVFAHVFTEPGEYRYYCSIHGNESVGMVGTVVVTG